MDEVLESSVARRLQDNEDVVPEEALLFWPRGDPSSGASPSDSPPASHSAE